MSTFIDTSAIYALLDADDTNHPAAAEWIRGPGREEHLLSHNYVLVESAALVQRRLGLAASHALFDAVAPTIDVIFVDEPLHTSAVRAWLSFGTRRLSLVDWVSFEVIKAEGIGTAFAFDDNFGVQGIAVVPSG